MRTYEVEARTLEARSTAVADAVLLVPEIGAWLGTAYTAVEAAIADQGIEVTGPPFARYHRLDEDRFAIEAGVPVAVPIEPAGAVHGSTLPGGPAASTVHTGPFEEMEPGYDAVVAWIEAWGGHLTGDPWEVYLSDPAEEPDPDAWRTEIVQPYAV